jgi:tripeptide aminopeptidase
MKEITDKMLQRFLKYVTFDTESVDESNNVPTSEGQFVFARYLAEELEAMGLTEITLDEKGYLYATLPANCDKNVPVVGFIAHLDTSPDMSGKDVKPSVVQAYEGGDIVLCEKDDIVLKVSDFPEVEDYKGHDLVVTDGHTLLGADDKAGIAEIVSAIAYLQAHPEIKHGKVRIAFNPDEEIGRGAHNFNVPLFGCDWAYTVDGSCEGELEFENFNAASAKIMVNGRSVHPGYAKDKMINAARVATELTQMLPQDETPETTEGYQGFYHLVGISGGCEQANLSFIIRDHDRALFEQRKEKIREVVAAINEKYGQGVAELELKDQYYNMREKVEPMMYVVDIAKDAVKSVGVEPKVKAIRGGTDGAQLSFMGLPCPNIFAGGLNFHGPHEFCPVQSMQKAMMTVVNIVKIVAERL